MLILPRASHESEEIMEKVKKISTNKDQAAPMKQLQEANHWKRIRSQAVSYTHLRAHET